MNKLINMVLLYGGKSLEHEISLRSAASILMELDTQKYNIIPIGMDKNGQFYVNDYQDMLNYSDCLPVSTTNSRHLSSLLYNGGLAVDADIVFPIVHGPLYEDGALQGLLELSNTAYVGCDVLSSAICMDKEMTRRIVCNQHIKSAATRSISWYSSAQERQNFCQQVIAEFGWPLFVKPCSLGSSVGTHKVHNKNDLTNAITDALRYDNRVLVEQAIPGREIEIAVLENITLQTAPKVSVPGEICPLHQHGFYSYAAKYLESDKTQLIIPALLDAQTIEQLQAMAKEIFVTLRCKGMARIDFFIHQTTHEIYFNEINSIPGFTSISMYPKMWQATGLKYADLLDELIKLGLKHYHCRQQLIHDYR